MLPLHLGAPSGAPLSVLAIGAHPDDIEIGAGGPLLSLAEEPTAGPLRGDDGNRGTSAGGRGTRPAFLPDADLTIELFDLPEGRLPAVWGR